MRFGSTRRKYSTCAIGIVDVGLVGRVEIELCSEALQPESAVRLGIENDKGERYETFVLLNTKIKTLAEEFLKQFSNNFHVSAAFFRTLAAH